MLLWSTMRRIRSRFARDQKLQASNTVLPGDLAPGSDHSLATRVLACLSYGASSIAIMLSVKLILTEMKFKSFLFVSFIQQAMAILVLLGRQALRQPTARFPLLTWPLFIKLLPLSMLFSMNILCGLYATRDLSMPSFVLFRRFSIALTMIGEFVVLHRTPTFEKVFPVCILVASPLIASQGSFHTDMKAISALMVNNVLTALQGVVLRERIDSLSSQISSEGIMFYNACMMVLLTFTMLLFNALGERDFVMHFEFTPLCVMMLFVNSFMGFLVNASMYYCTRVTSPLTTAIVGSGKNVVTSLVGMLLSDYVYTPASLTGILLSAFGTLLYSSGRLTRRFSFLFWCLRSSSKGAATTLPPLEHRNVSYNR